MENGGTEAIFFFDETGISKEMLYSEFEAFLDGMISMPDLVGQIAQVCYVNVAPGLKVTSIVFFNIAFGKDGMADAHWNMPLRSLSDKGISGPDLGGGPVKIAMKSKSSLPEYADSLWDPMERSGKNDLIHIRDAVIANRLHIADEFDGSSADLEDIDNIPVAQVSSAIADDDIPVASTVASNQEIPIASQVSAAPAIDGNEFSQATKIIESQRLRIASLESQILESERTLHELAAAKADLEAQLGQRLAVINNLQEEMKALQNKGLSHEEVIEKVKKSHENQLVEFEKQKKIEQEKVEKHYQKFIKKREREVTNRLKSNLDAKDQEMKLLQISLDQQNKELTQLRGDKFHMLKGGGDDIFEKIDAAGISFITFRPGAGHLTIPLNEMNLFLDDPEAYSANKCNVSLDSYQVWLKHYSNPVCNAHVKANEICGGRVMRIDAPANFKPAESDRCAKHLSS